MGGGCLTHRVLAFSRLRCKVITRDEGRILRRSNWHDIILVYILSKKSAEEGEISVIKHQVIQRKDIRKTNESGRTTPPERQPKVRQVLRAQ